MNINAFLKDNFNEIRKLSDTLFNNPELGFKETETKKIIVDYIKRIDSNINIQNHSITGLSISIGDGDKNIGIIAEMDAVYAPNHFNSNKETGAAHNCGHFSQIALSLVIFKYFYTHPEELTNKLTFVFTPAEEFLDLNARKKMIIEEKINFYSGKINMINEGVFDNIDVAISWHSFVSNQFDYDINGTLAGFVYLEYEFIGKPAHAGLEPQVGINSLDFAVDLYQYFRQLESQYGLENVRINPKIIGDDELNIVSSKTTLKTYIRYLNIEHKNEIINNINNYISSKAQEKNIQIKTNHNQGYLPFNQFSEINDLFIKSNESTYKISRDLKLFASGDIGDLSYLIPTVQFGYRGFSGNIHGNDFEINDYHFIYINTAQNFINLILDVNNNLNSLNLFKRTKNDYLKNINLYINT